MMRRRISIQRIEPSFYEAIWHRFGGSFITHPRVVASLDEAIGLPVSYYGIYRGADVVGAVPAWGDWIAGHREALSGEHKTNWYQIDCGEPEFILPIDPSISVDLPFRATRISGVHKDQIKGLDPYTRGKQPHHMLARPHGGHSGFSKGTRNQLKRQLRRMTEAGGEVLPVSVLSAGELAEVYTRLHSLRWGGNLPQGHANLAKLFHVWRDLLFGSLIRLNGRVIAVEISYHVLSPRCLYIEGVQGAWDPAYAELAPGSVIMYVNTRDAWALAQEQGVPLRYSFGYAGDEKGYKHMWCEPQLLYQTRLLRHSPARRLVHVAKRLANSCLGFGDRLPEIRG